ncbi:MAG: class I SAM-dependent DNA methyltransferase [Nanobdellota archaeon]
MKAQEIKKKYDDFADKYEQHALADKYRAFRIMGQWALQEKNDRHLKVLDLGCGTGLSSQEFFKKKHTVIGTDISPNMLKEAKKYPYKKLIEHDLEKPIPVEDNEFDIITLIGVMEFIKQPTLLFKRIRKKLKNDGIFLITIPKKQPKHSGLKTKSYYKKDIEPCFKEAGFRIKGTKTFLGYYKTINDKRHSSTFWGYLLEKRKT